MVLENIHIIFPYPVHYKNNFKCGKLGFLTKLLSPCLTSWQSMKGHKQGKGNSFFKRKESERGRETDGGERGGKKEGKEFQ